MRALISLSLWAILTTGHAQTTASRPFTAAEFVRSFSEACATLDLDVVSRRAIALGFVRHSGAVPLLEAVPQHAWRRGNAAQLEFLIWGHDQIDCASVSQGVWARDMMTAIEAFATRQTILAQEVFGAARAIYVQDGPGLHAILMTIGFLDQQRAVMLLGRRRVAALPAPSR